MRVNSAQGTRNNNFQFPVSGAIVPSSLHNGEYSNNGADSYFGVGRVRASSAGGGKRPVIRNSLDLTSMIMASKINNPNTDDSPRMVGLNQPGGRPQSSGYDQMKLNTQKMSYSDYMANKPPTGARAMSAGGNGINPYSPSPRVQQYSLITNSTPFSAHGYNGNSPNTAGLYHIMSNGQGTTNAAGSTTTPLSLLSSSMPLTSSQLTRPGSANGGPISKAASSDSAEVCSILSTSSLSKKGQARNSGTPTTKKRVRFAEKLAVYHSDVPIRNTPPPYLGTTPPMATKKTVVVPLGAGTGISFMDSVATSAAVPADVQYTANLANGTLIFHDTTPLLPTSNSVTPAGSGAVSTAPPPSGMPSSTKLPVINGGGGVGGLAVKKTAVATSSPASVSVASPSLVGPPNNVTAKSPSPTMMMAAMDLDSSGGSNDSSQPQTNSTYSSTTAAPAATSLGPVHIPPATSGAFYLSQPASTTTNPAPAAAMTPAGAAATAAVNATAAGKKKPVRPSLSEQLATIGAKAEAITTDIRQKANLPGPSSSSAAAGASATGEAALFSMPARCFTIGSLSCRFPSPIHFFPDRCEYIFNHPFEASVINMIIYYRDMTAISILGTKLKFKLPKKLACFLSDFDPQNPHHVISIEMSSMLSISMIKEKILPLISQFNVGGVKSVADILYKRAMIAIPVKSRQADRENNIQAS